MIQQNSFQEEGAGEGERERGKACGDFRNSSPKFHQIMLCCTLRNCSNTGCFSSGKPVCSDVVTVNHLFSRAIRHRHNCTVNTVKCCAVSSSHKNMLHFKSTASGYLYTMFHLLVISEVSSLAVYVMMWFHCIVGKTSVSFKPGHTT